MASLYTCNGVSVCMLVFFLLSMIGPSHGQLTAGFYSTSCPKLQYIVYRTMQQAVQKEARMAASILRLFFHDCFVQGCDGSILLDDTATFQGEKTAGPNNNSARGFDVIDNIKSNVETACKGVVSCADILALAARDGVVLSGGPYWTVLLGRRDATTASFNGANSNIPSPFSDVDTLTAKFQAQGLSVQDMVTLSGAHTIGQARCLLFRQRLYNQTGDSQPDSTLSTSYLTVLRTRCPSSGGDDNLSPLDPSTTTYFDNCYYNNLQNQRGLLTSDQTLFSTSGSPTIAIVQDYGKNPRKFSTNFATSMINLGNINPLTGPNGEIRQNCRAIN